MGGTPQPNKGYILVAWYANEGSVVLGVITGLQRLLTFPMCGGRVDGFRH